MKSKAFELFRRPGALSCSLALMLVSIFFAGAAHAQDAQGFDRDNQEPPPEDASQQVDESDESYRQRMELRDGFPGQQTRIETTYSAPASNAKIDKLPLPSQKHIKTQLREMIIENGQWEPGQDLSDYPYEPSATAQTDAQLRGKEREAWAEELQKYQEREATAYAQATGQEPGQETGEGNAAKPGEPGAENGAEGTGKGEQGGADSSSSQNSAAAEAERQAKAMQAAAAYQGTSSTAEEAVSTAGVSESALGYLQSMNGGGAGANPGGTPQQAGGQEGEQASGQQSADGSAGQAAQMAQQGSGSQSGQPTAESAKQESSQKEPITEDLAGTIAVEDLQNLFAESGQSAGNPARDQSINLQESQTLIVIEPGTLTIEELRKLDTNLPERP